jgi:hypothetical protein
LKLAKRDRFVARAAVEVDHRSGLKTALSHSIELGRGVRDGDG